MALETLPKYFKQLEIIIKKMHSDKLPFIGSIEVNNVSHAYLKWLKGEVK